MSETGNYSLTWSCRRRKLLGMSSQEHVGGEVDRTRRARVRWSARVSRHLRRESHESRARGVERDGQPGAGTRRRGGREVRLSLETAEGL